MKRFVTLTFFLLCSILSYTQLNPLGEYISGSDSLSFELQNSQLLIDKGETLKASYKLLKIIKKCQDSDDNSCRISSIQANVKLAYLLLDDNLYRDANRRCNLAISLLDNEDYDKLQYDVFKLKGDILSREFDYHTLHDSSLSSDYENYPALARENYEKAQRIANKIGNRDEQALLLINIGNSYLQEKNYIDAEFFYINAEKLNKIGESNKELKQLIDMSLALIHVKRGRYRKAISEANKILNNIDKSDIRNNTIQSDMYFILAEAHSGLRNYNQSNALLFKVLELDKAKIDSKTQEQLKHIEERYNNDLLKENTKKAKKKAYLLTSILGGAFLLLFLLSSLIFARNKMNQRNLVIDNIRLQQKADLEAIHAIMDAKENERDNIGRYLHDQITPLLNGANMQLDIIANEHQLSDDALLDKTQVMIDDASEQIRTLSHQLSNEILNKFGLEIAIDDLCLTFSNPRIQFDLSSSLEEGSRYRKSIETKIYGVVQELINNVIKHSGATESLISLYEKENLLYVDVVDNGIGFSEIDDGRGSGLKHARTRIHSLGGDLTVKRIRKNRTSVRITVPIDS